MLGNASIGLMMARILKSNDFLEAVRFAKQISRKSGVVELSVTALLAGFALASKNGSLSDDNISKLVDTEIFFALARRSGLVVDQILSPFDERPIPLTSELRSVLGKSPASIADLINELMSLVFIDSSLLTGEIPLVTELPKTSHCPTMQTNVLRLSDRHLFKLSIGRASAQEDAKYFDEAIASSYILLSWEDIDWSDSRYESSDEILKTCINEGQISGLVTKQSGQVQQTDIFRNRLRIGDVVIVSRGNSLFRAIGLVTGEYEYYPRPEKRFTHRRATRWLWVEPAGVPVQEIYKNNFIQASIYQLNNGRINIYAIEEFINGRKILDRPSYKSEIAVVSQTSVESKQNSQESRLRLPASGSPAALKQMHVFMSYRRDDAISYRLDYFKKIIDEKFGYGTAFFDIDDIPFGIDFREHIFSNLDKATIVLVFIGDKWLGERPDGTRRIDLENDFVRLEVEAALKSKIPVVPIFTDRATYQLLENLPPSLEDLKFRNGIELRKGPDLEAQQNKLIKKLEEYSTKLT